MFRGMVLTTTSGPCWRGEAHFRARAASALMRDPAPFDIVAGSPDRFAPSDFDLDPEMFWELASRERPRPAAVLVPVARRAELSLILTARTHHLPSHAGQISFPGGKVDEDDGSPRETALREAEEEIGLDRRFVEPLGYLDCYRTGTGYCITPVVALVDPAATLAPNPHEVAEVFEVPLRFLFDAANHELHARVLSGRERRFHAMRFGAHFIWGATAGIIKNMHTRFTRA